MKRSGFVILASVFIVAAFFIGLFEDVWGVGARWMHFTEAYSDGWLMFAVSIFLAARQWRYQPPVLQPQPLWLMPLLGAALMYSVAEWLRVEVVQDFLLVPMLLMALGAIWGWRQLQRFLIPIGVLCMVIPFWDFLNMPLQVMTVQANKVLLAPLGISFNVNGIYINLHHVGVIEVENGCSGLRYLIVAISLCLIHSHLTFERWRTIIKFVATGAAFGIVTNWLRVYVITLVAYESHMKANLVRHHDFFGWVLFGVVLIPLFWLGGRYRKVEQARMATENSDNGAVARTWVGPSRAIWVLTIAIVLLLSPRLVNLMRTSSEDGAALAISLSAPSGWLPAFSGPASHWKPTMHGATTTVWKSWIKLAPQGKSGDDFMSGYVATYMRQRPGRELVQYGNRLFDDSTWKPVESFSIRGSLGRDYSAMRLKNRQSGKSIYVAYGYYVSGLWVGSEIQAKLAQLAGLFNGRRDDSLIAVGIECGVVCGSSKEELDSVMDSISNQAKSQLDAFESAK